MIDREFFEKKIDETLDLMGSNLKRRTKDLIFEKIQYNYENSDLSKALNNLASTSDKLTYASLIKNMDYYAAIRREEERAEEVRQEEARNKQFWKENLTYIKQGMCNRKCIKCHVKYCNLIHSESIKAIKAMLNKEKTLAQVNKEMAEKFEGWQSNFINDPF